MIVFGVLALVLSVFLFLLLWVLLIRHNGGVL